MSGTSESTWLTSDDLTLRSLDPSPPAISHRRPNTRMNETHAPSAWGRSQVFAQSSATKWDVHKEGKDSVAKPGVKREAARAPVFHQVRAQHLARAAARELRAACLWRTDARQALEPEWRVPDGSKRQRAGNLSSSRAHGRSVARVSCGAPHIARVSRYPSSYRPSRARNWGGRGAVRSAAGRASRPREKKLKRTAR